MPLGVGLKKVACEPLILHPTYEAVNDRVLPADTPAYNCAMHIIAIGWLYVAGLMALTESSIVAGILTFIFYGLMPVALLSWLGGSHKRRQRRREQERLDEALDELARQPDGQDTKRDQ